MKKTLFEEKRKLYKTLRYLLVFLFFFFFCQFLVRFHVFVLLTQLFQAFLPFFLGLLLAFLLEPLMHFFEKKFPKLVAVLLPFLLLIIVMLLLGFLIVPSFLKEGSEFLENFPEIIRDIQNFLENIWPFTENVHLKQTLFQVLNQLPSVLHQTLEKCLPQFCSHVFFFFTTSFFTILIGIYLLYDFPKIKAFLNRKISPLYQKDTHSLCSTLRNSFNRYILGLFLVMFLVFLTQFIGLSLAGMRSPVFFASLCALTDLIPYVGPYLGGIPCVLIAFSMSKTVGICTLISILVVQFLENSFYQPYILGKTLYLPPWLILTGIVFASSFFGLFGMLLVSPILMMLKILFPFFQACLKKRRDQKKS